MKKKLFLITESFPYGTGEKTFIKPELPYLIDKFDVTIISCADANTKSDISNITRLDEDIKILSLMPINDKIKKIKYIVLAFFSLTMWREWIKIIREKHNTFSNLYYALWHYISSELFYNQLSHTIKLNNALVYTYWNNIRTLGVCRHKCEHVGLKIITRVHGCDLYNDRGLGKRQYFRWLVNCNLDAIFFVSQKGLAYYRDAYQVHEMEKLIYCPLGISDMLISSELQEDDGFMLVSCSSVIPLKRVDLIVKALAEIKTSCKVHWVHFGDGSEMANIKELARLLLSKCDKIIYEFKGQENNSTIRQYYASHDIRGFITTSSTEGGCPVSIQEALCAAVPIIGTNVGGISEMIDGNGFLLSNNPSVDEVVDAIEKLLNLSIEKNAEMKKRSREIWQEKYRAENNFQYFIDRIQKIII